MLDYNTIFFVECQDRNVFLFHFVNFIQTKLIYYSRLTSKNIPFFALYVQLHSIEIIAEKAVLHLVTHHFHKNSFHCFSLQPPAWHTLFSFNCVFFFLNDLFRAFRCTGIGKIPHPAVVLSGKVDNDVVRFMSDAVGLNPDHICFLDDFRAGNIVTHESDIR